MPISADELMNNPGANPEIVAQIKTMMDENSANVAQAKFDKTMSKLAQTVKDFAAVNKLTFAEIAKNVKQYADRIRAAYKRAYGEPMPRTSAGGVPINNVQAIQLEAENLQKSEKPVLPLYKAIAEASKATVDAEKNTRKWWASIKQLAGGLGIFTTIAMAVRMVVRYLSEAINMAKEFDKNIFTLQVGVRAMQRSGIQVTMAEVSSRIDEVREKYKVFSTQDIVQGTATATIKLRQLGASWTQIGVLMEEASKLAILSGQKFSDVAQDISYAITTGYSRTLRNLGIAFSRAQLNVEAYRMGLSQSYDSLSQSNKLLVAQSLIERQVAGYSEDIAKYSETYAGKIDEANSSLEESKTILGGALLPIWASIVKAVSYVVQGVVRGIPLIAQAIKLSWQVINHVIDADEFKKQFKEIQNEAANVIKGIRTDLDLALKGVLSDESIKSMIGEFTDAEQTIISEAFGELINAYEDEWIKWQQKLEDIDEKYAQERLDAMEEYNQKIIDSRESYVEKLQKLEIENNRALVDAARDYNFDLESIQIDFENSKLDLQEKFNQETIEKEEELQRKLQELQDKALFDLEEAVRTGDARKAREILRKYRFDRLQAQRDAQLGTVDRQAQFQRELADLARQAQRRADERRIEYERKLEDLEREYAYERELAQQNFERDMADNRKWLAEKYADIEKARNRDIEQARRDYERALADLALSFKKQFGLTEAMAQAISKMVNYYFGDSSSARAIMEGFWKAFSPQYTAPVNPTAAIPTSSTSTSSGSKAVGGALASQIGMIGMLPSVADFYTKKPLGIPWYAKGGAFIASRPMLAGFGEQVPELVTATPLSQLGRSGYNGASGNLAIEILLSEGLESRIVDKSMGKLRGVLASVRRMTK